MLEIFGDRFNPVHDFGIFSASSDDAKGIAKLSKECFATGWSTDQLMDLVSDKTGHIWIAQSKSNPNEIIGYLLIRAVGEEAEILSIGTEEKYRRKGIGEKLLKTAINQLRASYVATLFLEVSTLNIPALELYSQLGFYQVGLRKAYYKSTEGGPNIDAVSYTHLTLPTTSRV